MMKSNQETKAKPAECPICEKKVHDNPRPFGTNKRGDIKGNTFTQLNKNKAKSQHIKELDHQFRRKGLGETEIDYLKNLKDRYKQFLKSYNNAQTNNSDKVWIEKKLHENREKFKRVPEDIQVHHLIGISAVGGTDADFNEKWYRVCFMLGYDINCAQNSVILPSDMLSACHYEVPLHKGGHDATEVKIKKGRRHEIIQAGYTLLVKSEVEPVLNEYYEVLKDKMCDDVDSNLIRNFHQEMFDISNLIFKNIRDFMWFISADAEHYHQDSKIGCYNLCRTIDGKMIEMANDRSKKVTKNTRARNFFFKNDLELTKGCPDGRDHFTLGCRDEKGTSVRWEEARYDVMITDEELGIK